MPYVAEISRANPSVFLFLVDQSGSMGDPFGGGNEGQSKAVGLSDALNRLLHNLVIKCTKSEGVRDYFHVGVVGYGSQAGVGSAFSARIASETLIPISRIADTPLRIEERLTKTSDGAGGLVDLQVKLPVWIDPRAEDGTPMCAGLQFAWDVLSNWIAAHPDSYPPTLLNITDGAATDGDPLPMANSVMQLATADGNVLLYNCHISSFRSSPVVFPSEEGVLPHDEFATRLFRMSSTLPPKVQDAAVSEGYELGPGARGFAFNTDLVELIRFIDIGTRPALR